MTNRLSAHPRRITFFGTYDERNHPRVHVLREGLASAGHDVTVVNVPLRLDTAARVELVRKPWTAPLVAARILRAWVQLAPRFRALPAKPEVVIVGYLGAFDIHLARVMSRATVVLDQMVTLGDTVRDRELTGKSSMLLRALDWLDRRAARAADLILVDTAEHLALIPADDRSKGVVMPVGAPAEWRREGAARHDGGGPLRVVFFGLFTPLQGAPTIGAALALLADDEAIHTSMIGSGQDHAETRRLAAPNQHVMWHDLVDSTDLPGLVADHDVCLGIFGTGPKALRVVPNKVFQGAAAGLAIVTSETPPQRALLGSGALYVTPGDADELATALRMLAHDPERLAELRAQAAATAARLTPRSIVEPFEAAIEGVL